MIQGIFLTEGVLGSLGFDPAGIGSWAEGWARNTTMLLDELVYHSTLIAKLL